MGPPPAPSMPGALPTSPSFQPPSAPGAIDDFAAGPTWVRPPFPEEVESIRRFGSSPVVKVGRVVGLLGGAGSAVLGVEAFIGVPLDPVAYPVLLVVFVFLGIGAAAAARGARGQASRALKSGLTETEGPLQWGEASRGGWRQAHVYGSRLVLPRKLAETLSNSPTTRIAWAGGGRGGQFLPGVGPVKPVLFVSVNGGPLARPVRGYLAPP